MHRQRKKDIAILLVAAIVITPIYYFFMGWIGVLMFLGITVAAYKLGPTNEDYLEMDRMFAERELKNE